MILFEKAYDGKSIVDIERDVYESFDSRFNPIVESIPFDKHGFQQGVFKVTIVWLPNN